jgi:oligopeptide transport system substrate-binding protein
MWKFLPIILGLCLTFSCQTSSQPPRENRQILRTCMMTDIPSLDPRTGTDMLSQGVVHMLHAGLAYLDREMKPRLDLASSYQASPDYTTYTFTLRECYWSDGSKITAHDFEETWKAALTPPYASTNTNLFYFLKNGKKANDGEVPFDQVGVKALDDKTLLVELEHPHPHFISVVINTVFSPVHHSLRHAPVDEKNLISSGPFCLKSHSLHNQITLEKNPHYWDAESVHLDQIDYLVIKDPATALMMFEKGEIDWMGEPLTRLSTDALPDLKQKGLLRTLPAAGTQWLFFNTNKPPLNNVNIRKALAYAVDRCKIQHDILHEDNPTPALGLIPRILKKERWHPWFQDNDIAKAREYFTKGLEELGTTADQLEPIALHFPINPTWAKILQAIQQMWEKNLGVKVKCEGCDAQIFFTQLYNFKHDIARFGWIMQYDDLVNLLEVFKFKNKRPNCTGWESPAYIHHTNASYSDNEETRWRHVEAAEKIFFDEMPAIPICDIVISYVQQPHVKGVVVNHLYQIDFRWATIDTSAH